VMDVPPLVGPEFGLIEVMVGSGGAKNVNALTLVAVPPGVITEISFAPTVPAGVVAVIDVALTTATFVAARPSTVTLVAPVKLVPIRVMAVPPKVVPEFGLTEVIIGAGTTYVNALALVAVPPAVVTATLFAPVVPAGVIAVIDVALTTTTLVAALPPMVTLVAPVKLVPVIVISVPPKVEPLDGLTLEIVGSSTTYVNALVFVAVPPSVVTEIALEPTPAGVLAVMKVSL